MPDKGRNFDGVGNDGSTGNAPAHQSQRSIMTDNKITMLLNALQAAGELSNKGVKDLLEHVQTRGVNGLIPQILETNVKSDEISKAISRTWDMPDYPRSIKPSLAKPNDPVPTLPPTKKHGGGDKDGWLFANNGVLYLVNPLNHTAYRGVLNDLKSVGLKQLGVISRASFLRAVGLSVPDVAAEAGNSGGATGTQDNSDKFRKMVDAILQNAIRNNASDIHFEPATNDVRLRLRIENRMRTQNQFSHEDYLKIANILLSMTNKGKAGTYLEALDDMFVYTVPPSRRVKMRVMMIPVVVPERQESMPCFCLRILGNNIEKLGLRDLGIPDTEKNPQLTKLQLLMERKNGLILISGPTGSGKTTTLTAILSEMQRMHPDRCRYTVEDPVEMNLAGVNHVQVNEEAQLTFARAIKSFLRGDPDEIMVGEIRDGTVGGLATTASITGHLAFSTIHTNSAIQCVARLIDMGCDSYIVSDSLRAATAQRLVRKVCPQCCSKAKWGALIDGSHEMFQDPENALMKFRYSHAPKIYSDLDDYPKNPDMEVRIANPSGCTACGNSGYAKRILITELFEVTPAIVDLIARRASSTEIKKQALKEGFKEMWQHGGNEVWVKKTTTFDEMIQCLGERERFVLSE